MYLRRGEGGAELLSVKAVQVAFLLFEALFGFISAVVSALKNSRDIRSKRIVTVLNVLAGSLMLFDFLGYVLEGKTRPVFRILNSIANLNVFLLCHFILLAYLMYLSVTLLDPVAKRTHKVQCRIRLWISAALGMAGIVLVVISQFTRWIYSIDESNVYHRGPLFGLSVLLPLLAMCVIMTILVQSRKYMGKYRFWTMMSYILLTLIGLVLQIVLADFVYMDLGIAISIHIMFFENIVHQNREIRRAERTDIRTGLANEHSCIERIRAIRGSRKLTDYASVYFDLTKFALINRKYGVDTGNAVLNSYVRRISVELDEEEILGRQHGDQFIAIVKKEKLQKILSLLAGVKVSFRNEMTGEVQEELVASKAGVYEIENSDISAEDIITYAGTALDHAKSISGRSVIYMTQELMDSLEERKRLEIEIRKALQNVEFTPYYQPKVNSVSGKLCGAEALSRWVHSDEIVMPSKFIPFMEMNDTICELDLLMLRQVCEDIRKWAEEGIQVPPISLNMSRRNLADPHIAEKINDIVVKSGIPKELLEIEITETIDEFPISVLKKFVDQLHAKGFAVSVDDFGCASSSLALLREIHFDTMKIDKGFIDHDHPKDLTILKHIVQMALAIGLNIVAEGVELKPQVDTLRSLGVETIQGYYYDKPLSREEIHKRIQDPVYF